MCGVCGKQAQDSLCRKCEIKLRKQALFRIEDYKEITSFFNKHIYIFHYDSLIRDKIIDYKFNEKAYLYNTFVCFLKKNEKICVQIKKYDIIVSVPISKRRFKERGYNQSALFAKNLAQELKMKYLEKVLIKVRDNPAQSTLNQEEREENVKNMYKINILTKSKIYGKKILLVDDIFTTGSTVNECSKVLIDGGALNVGVLTIAKD